MGPIEPEGMKKASTTDVFSNHTVSEKPRRILKACFTALNCGKVPLTLVSSGNTSGIADRKGNWGGSGDIPGEVNTATL